jgi:hypothetical protein
MIAGAQIFRAPAACRGRPVAFRAAPPLLDPFEPAMLHPSHLANAPQDGEFTACEHDLPEAAAAATRAVVDPSPEASDTGLVASLDRGGGRINRKTVSHPKARAWRSINIVEKSLLLLSTK